MPQLLLQYTDCSIRVSRSNGIVQSADFLAVILVLKLDYHLNMIS